MREKNFTTSYGINGTFETRKDKIIFSAPSDKIVKICADDYRNELIIIVKNESAIQHIESTRAG